jgi:hypothetical protein
LPTTTPSLKALAAATLIAIGVVSATPVMAVAAPEVYLAPFTKVAIGGYDPVTPWGTPAATPWARTCWPDARRTAGNRRRRAVVGVPMRTTRLLAAALLAALPAACGDDGEDTSTGGDTDGGPRAVTGTPGGTDSGLFVEVVNAGGFVPMGFDFRNLPVAAIHADGRVFAPGAITLQFPGPAVLPVFTGQLDDGALEDLLAAAAEAGLLDDDAPDYGGQADLPIADASTTRVTVVVDGEEHVVEAYALEFTDGLPPEVAEARAALADFVAAVNEAVLAARDPFDPDRYRVLATAPIDPTAVDPGLPQPNVLDWPAGLPEPVEGECTALTGDAAAAFEAALEQADEQTQWRIGERTFGLFARPVLPHEPDCPAGG